MAPIRSIHEIHLTEQGQLYAIVVGPRMTTFVDNTGIISHYEVTHKTADEQAAIEEFERKRLEAETAAELARK